MTQLPARVRVGVLVSGSGTNLQAMIDKAASGILHADIAVVLSDRPDAYGLIRAEKAGIPSFCVNYSSMMEEGARIDAEGRFPDDLDELDRRQKILRNPDGIVRRRRLAGLVHAEREMARILDSYGVEYVCLAGFMRLVTPFFIGRYNSGETHRLLNIHPALLPSFPGQHGYEDTFSYGCKWGGITVHFVDEGEDTGPIIAQAVYPILPGDTPDTIRARGLRLEYAVYSQVVNWLAGGFVLAERLPDGGTRITVTDPAYRKTIEGWLRLAACTE